MLLLRPVLRTRLSILIFRGTSLQFRMVKVPRFPPPFFQYSFSEALHCNGELPLTSPSSPKLSILIFRGTSLQSRRSWTTYGGCPCLSILIFRGTSLQWPVDGKGRVVLPTFNPHFQRHFTAIFRAALLHYLRESFQSSFSEALHCNEEIMCWIRMLKFLLSILIFRGTSLQ